MKVYDLLFLLSVVYGIASICCHLINLLKNSEVIELQIAGLICNFMQILCAVSAFYIKGKEK